MAYKKQTHHGKSPEPEDIKRVAETIYNSDRFVKIKTDADFYKEYDDYIGEKTSWKKKEIKQRILNEFLKYRMLERVTKEAGYKKPVFIKAIKYKREFKYKGYQLQGKRIISARQTSIMIRNKKRIAYRDVYGRFVSVKWDKIFTDISNMNIIKNGQRIY